MKTAFVTFIYPGAYDFFEKFIKSLQNQTTHDFTLLVFNDGCKKESLSIFNNNYLFEIEVINNNHSFIAQTRLAAFKYLSNSEYEKFIFGDIDDTFERTRIQIISQTLNTEKIVFNELNIVNKKYELLQPNIIQTYLQSEKYVTFEMIRSENLIGFSHLAVTKEVMNFLAKQQISDDIHIVDWVVVSKALKEWDAYFEKETYTNYVFHENNIALESELTLGAILKEIDIKKKHYKELSYLDIYYIKELDFLEKVQIYMNEGLGKDVTDFSKSKRIIHYPWWSNLKDREEFINEV